MFWASHGYVYVVQDVRGRGESDGEFYPFIYEAEDGYDTQTWCTEQSWSSGKVGTTGGSYLGRANSRFGDGVLSVTRPDPSGDDAPDHFRYDPSDPGPFITEPNFSQVGGPDDYRAVERRDDVLVYTGPVLDEPLTVCGPLRVRLHAASSARDTDWTAKILDVHPDGFAQRLNDGIVRARFRNTREQEELLTPGAVKAYDIDCWSTCTVLLEGHRLRLEISSSAFPKFDRNLNTGGPIGKETKGLVAEQTVYHDRDRPSYLIVPVIER